MAGTQVDSSIYSQLAAPDPLGQLDKFAQFRAASNANAQFQQEFAARKAMGGIMQRSIDPATGQPDFQKASVLMAQDPATAFLAPDYMAKAQAMQGVSLDNTMKKLNNTQKILELTGNAAGSILSKGDSMTREDFTGAISNLYTALHENGVADPQIQDNLIQLLAKAPAGGPQLRQFVTQQAQVAAQAKDALDRTMSGFQSQSSGDATHFFWTNPNDHSVKYVGSVQNHMAPGPQNDLIQMQDKDGKTYYVPRYMAGPEAPGTFSNNPMVQMPNSFPGSQPQGPQQPQSDGATPPAQTSGAPVTAVPGIQGPSANPAAFGDNTAKISPLRGDQLKNMGDYQKNLNNQVEQLNSSILNLMKMRSLANQVHTGWGAEGRTEVGQVMQALGIPGYDEVANGSLAGSQMIQKFAAPAAMNVLRDAMGTQSRVTNMEFGAFKRANPNLETGPDAFKKILDFQIGMMKLKQREQKAYGIWTKAGNDPVDFPKAWTQQVIRKGPQFLGIPDIKATDSYTPYPKGVEK